MTLIVRFKNGGELVLNISDSYGHNIPVYLNDIKMTASSLGLIPLNQVEWNDVSEVTIQEGLDSLEKGENK